MIYSKKLLKYFKNPKNVGKIKNADAVGEAGNPLCLTPESVIYTDFGIKEMKDIKVGDKVLSHDGMFHKVLKLYRRNYRGKIYVVTTHNIGKVQMTSEHLMFIIKTSRYLRKYKLYRELTPGWFEVQELEKGDIPLYPVMNKVIDKKTINFDIPKLKWDFKSKDLPNIIRIDSYFLKIIGYYLSEGHVRTDKSKGTVGFTFNANEEDFVKDVVLSMRKVFNIDVSQIKSPGQNCIQVLFYSARLARFFEKYFGKGARNKCLPKWALLLPLEKQKYLLRGLWRGDGYFNTKKHKSKYVTISKNLAYQLKLLLLRQKIIFSFLKVSKKGIHKENYCFYIQERFSLKRLAEILNIKYKGRKKYKENLHSWFKGDFYYTPISNIKIRNYKGEVYNLEVEGTHSYTTEAAVVHNCGDIMRMYLKIRRDKKAKEGGEGDKAVIEEAKFETLGCGAAIATSSLMTEMVKGKTIEQALKVKPVDIVKELDLPKIKVHCSLLGIEALKAAIANYEKKRSKQRKR